MADVIRWMDGFDHYTVSQGSRKYNSWNLTSAMATGRDGTGQAAVANIATYRMEKNVAVSQAWRIGFGFKIITAGGATTSICRLLDSGSTQCEIQVTTGRNLQIARNGTLVGSAGSTSLSLDTWYHIEWYASIKDSISSGNCQLYINGILEINLAGGNDIKNTASAFADTVYLGTSGSWTVHFDDFVISTMDDTTTPTMLGDCKVITLLPDGNGNYSQWVGSDGNSTNNYQLVDETTNSDSDYVTSDVVGNRDSYSFANPSTAPSSIKAVQISCNMRKDDAGAVTGKLFTRSGGTDYDAATAISPSTSFEIRTHIMEVDPSTSAAWTSSNLNAIEAGIKVES